MLSVAYATPYTATLTTIAKRDGRLVDFDPERIETAIRKCFASLGTAPSTTPEELTRRVVNVVAARGDQVTVERVQDVVEMVLYGAGEFEAAKAYILYRAERTRTRVERPIPDEVQAAFDEAARYFASPSQLHTFFDKYARYNYEQGRRETWVECVDRSVDFLHELGGDRVEASTYAAIRKGMLEQRALPSMRLVAMAGEAARRQNLCIYNCSALPVADIDAFAEALLISMSGCGVGFSVERQFVEKFPRIQRQLGGAPYPFTVEDTTEGWIHAVQHGLEHWFHGFDVDFDFSQLRPAGAVLRIKGGHSSGPEPLRHALAFARGRILARQGSFLRPIDAHDIMCAIGNAAVAGGVRRTAMISLFDYDDMQMWHAKDGNFDAENSQRWNANNSAVWPEHGVTQTDFARQFLDMVQSERGEPGIFNRQAAVAMMPARRRELGNHVFLTNPCFAPGTLVQTRSGHYRIEDLVGKTVDLWNGEGWQTVDNFRVTATDAHVLRVTLQDGSELRVTPYHTMLLADGARVKASELEEGDRLALAVAPQTHGSIAEPGAYLKGFMLGDGTSAGSKPILAVHWPKFSCSEALVNSAQEITPDEEKLRSDAKRELGLREVAAGRILAFDGLLPLRSELLPWVTTYRTRLPARVFEWDLRSKVEFLSGYFDADGCALDGKTFGYQLCSIHRGLLLDVQSLLKTIGVQSKLSILKEARDAIMPDGHGGTKPYNAKQCWRLTISQTSAVAFAEQATFRRLTSFADRKVSYRIRPKFNEVVNIEYDGEYPEVYCCTVEGSHSLALTQGIQVGQCGEIVLRPYELCNLSITVARADDTFASLREKVELAAIIGTIQSLAVHFPGLRDEWRQNCEEERLLGVDINGQMDSKVAQDPDVQERLRRVAIEVNREYAGRFGINQAASVTCVKPSGNSSQLLDCSSGLHARWAPYYIRNMRISAHSPIFKVLQACDVPMDPENGQDAATANTWVIHFPVKAPEGAVTRSTRSAVEQCNYWLQTKVHWTEHNPSVTITYRPDEVLDLMGWVWKHRDMIGGMAFLPTFDAQYAQLPYIEIGKDEYERLAAAFPVIDYAQLYRYETRDETTSAQELACLAGVCELEL